MGDTLYDKLTVAKNIEHTCVHYRHRCQEYKGQAAIHEFHNDIVGHTSAAKPCGCRVIVLASVWQQWRKMSHLERVVRSVRQQNGTP